MTLPYNIVMLLADAVAIWLVSRRKRLPFWCVIVVLWGVAAFWLGAGLGHSLENHFGAMRLWCYGIFLHGTALLAATAVAWRRVRPKMARRPRSPRSLWLAWPSMPFGSSRPGSSLALPHRQSENPASGARGGSG